MPVRIANIVLAALAAALVPDAAAAAAEALPQKMQAAAIDAAGDAHALTPHQLPVPHPGPTEVLIAIHTAGVASWDVELRRHPEQIKNGRFPLILGTDGAGTVAALGANVRGFKVGDEVYSPAGTIPRAAHTPEYVAVPAERVGHVPP
jgi:NADPH:quinone reductase-like Zn-dependent oxidoreductase